MQTYSQAATHFKNQFLGLRTKTNSAHNFRAVVRSNELQDCHEFSNCKLFVEQQLTNWPTPEWPNLCLDYLPRVDHLSVNAEKSWNRDQWLLDDK